MKKHPTPVLDESMLTNLWNALNQTIHSITHFFAHCTVMCEQLKMRDNVRENFISQMKICSTVLTMARNKRPFASNANVRQWCECYSIK